jgi:hypothetical protein
LPYFAGGKLFLPYFAGLCDSLPYFAGGKLFLPYKHTFFLGKNGFAGFVMRAGKNSKKILLWLYAENLKSVHLFIFAYTYIDNPNLFKIVILYILSPIFVSFQALPVAAGGAFFIYITFFLHMIFSISQLPLLRKNNNFFLFSIQYIHLCRQTSPFLLD